MATAEQLNLIEEDEPALVLVRMDCQYCEDSGLCTYCDRGQVEIAESKPVKFKFPSVEEAKSSQESEAVNCKHCNDVPGSWCDHCDRGREEEVHGRCRGRNYLRSRR